MAVGDAYVFPGFFTPVLTRLFFPKPPTIFLTRFSKGERRKYAGKKVCPNQVSNSQPPCYESDTLTTEPSGRGVDSLDQSGQCTFPCVSGFPFHQYYQQNYFQATGCFPTELLWKQNSVVREK